MGYTTTTDFKGVTHFGNDQLMNTLEVNLKMFLDWSFLRVGGWTDVINPQVDVRAGDISKLTLTEDPSYSSGRVWQGIRKDWVWESGVNYVDISGNTQNPDVVGTPTINGVAATGAYHVNYPLGRIIFDTPISSSATIRDTYSYRNIQVYVADSVPWYSQLQYRSFRTDDVQVTQVNDSEWSIGGHHRIQLPTVIVESVPRGLSRPFELGNGALVMIQDVMFHVIAEDRKTRNDITDMIRQQSDMTIWLFNINDINASGEWPLDYRGMLVGDKVYTDLVADDGYRWRRCYLSNAVISEIESIHPNLHEGIVRTTTEVVLGG